MRLGAGMALLLGLVAGAAVWAAGPAGAGAAPSLLYTAATRYEPLAWIRGAERFPQGANIFFQGEARRKLIPDFAASADPNVSFDGQRVLFAGKRRPNDRWQIWEVAASGGSPRQVTACVGDCVRPFYLPEERVVYAQRVKGSFVIEAAPLAAGKALRLTYAPGNFLPADVLRDGRILFEAAYPLGGSAVAELYTVYSDGSGVESYRCDHGKGRYAGRQVGSGDIVFAQGRGMARFTSALAQQSAVAMPAGDYAGDVEEGGDGSWLVSARAKLNEHYRIARWAAGSGTTTLSEPGVDVVQPVLLRERPVPSRHPSALHEWNYANLLCLNSYTSKYTFAESSIGTVRLYTRGAGGTEVALGTAAVEQDGSFYLRTPADQPLKIELLDRSGKTLKKEAGWFWLRKGEQRVCVGCHAGPEAAPENAVPQVLQRSVVAADLTRIPGSAVNAKWRIPERPAPKGASTTGGR